MLEHGIRGSASVAVCVGRDGLGPWEKEEMQAALQLAVRESFPVIPVLLPETPLKPELPMFLANRTWVDLRDGLDGANLGKLVWGITGRKPTASTATSDKPSSGSASLATTAEPFVGEVLATLESYSTILLLHPNDWDLQPMLDLLQARSEALYGSGCALHLASPRSANATETQFFSALAGRARMDLPAESAADFETYPDQIKESLTRLELAFLIGRDGSGYDWQVPLWRDMVLAEEPARMLEQELRSSVRIACEGRPRRG